MTSDNPKGIIELGNIFTKCIIFKINENNVSEILSTSIIKSEGIHNGVIVNLEKASNIIRKCISSAEKKAKLNIKKITVIVEQPEFLCTKLSKHRKIDGSKIKKYDIDFLLKEAKKQVLNNDRKQSIIHIFNHNYIVDSKTFIEEPIDVFANSFSHEMTFITMPQNNLKNIEQAFFNCDIEAERYISCTFALAVKYLNNHDFQSGSILIDIGHEKISYGLFKNLAIVHSATLSIGVNHIVKDISKVCLLDLDESKALVEKIDFSFQNNEEIFDTNNYLKDIFFNSSNYRKISKSLVLDIVKARIDETFEIIKKQIIESGFNPALGTNLFVVGGGSNLVNIDQYCSKIFSSNIKNLSKNNGTENNEFERNFMSCLGAIKIIKDGWETEAIPEIKNKNAQKLGFFAKIFNED
jgi:cell division protein FtsA